MTDEAKNEVATTQCSALTVQGDENEGLQLSKIVLYQGTAEEETRYGEQKRGHWLDALESRSLGDAITIVPVLAWYSWAKFIPGSNRPVYSTRNKSEVPPEDLSWSGPDEKTPPAATITANVVVVVEGEPWPYLVQFKRTSLACFEKTIKMIEGRRGAIGKSSGMYKLTSSDATSAEGKPYKKPVAQFLGDPTDELSALAGKVFAAGESQIQSQADTVEDAEVPF